MEDISNLNKQRCVKGGHFWTGKICKPLSIDNITRADIIPFCEAAKGTLVRMGSKISLSDRNFVRETAKLCGFEAIHIANDVDRTEWAPNIPKMLDATGNHYIEHLTKQAVACSKNNVEEVLGDYDSIKSWVLEDLTDDEKKEIKKGDLDLEKKIQDKIQSEMEFICQDTWDAINENVNSGLTGHWKGDTKDNYDLGETENLYTNDRLDSVFEEIEDAFEESESEDLPLIEHQGIWEVIRNNPILEGESSRRFNMGESAADELLNHKWQESISLLPNSIDIQPIEKEDKFDLQNVSIKLEKDRFPSVNKFKKEKPLRLSLERLFVAEANREALMISGKPSNSDIRMTAGKWFGVGQVVDMKNKKEIIIGASRVAGVNPPHIRLKDTRML